MPPPYQLKLKTSSGCVYFNMELSLVTKLYRMKMDCLCQVVTFETLKWRQQNKKKLVVLVIIYFLAT